MKDCGDRGDYKTYCAGIFELFTKKNIIIGYVHVFPFFALRFFFFFTSGKFDDFVSSKTR